jgi:hypothetical protein
MNIRLFVLAGICAVATGAARAADNCSGSEATFDNQTEIVELSKDHSVTLVRSASILFSEDAPAYHLTAGECTGSVLTTPDGKAQGTGHCLRRDKDGDSWSLEWALPPGTDKGTWKTTSGTGKFASKRSAGWFQEVRRDGKMAALKWGGTCK